MPFSKILNVSQAIKAKKQVVQRKTDLEIEIDKVKDELRSMILESEQYNNPEHFAKYGKIQRQIVQKDKVLNIMMKENKQTKAEQPQPEAEVIT